MAIVAFTGTSTILIACLAVAALNVVVRRETANVIEKQIQVLVQASRSVAPAILDHAGGCNAAAMNSAGLKALLSYTDEAFPQAQAFLTVSGAKHPNWVPASGFTGIVADRGKLEIRNLLSRQEGACKATVIFSLPVGPELAKRLTSAAGMDVIMHAPMPFRVHSPNQSLVRTIEGNFVPGITRPAAVVLTVRNWETGAMEDWIAYSIRTNYSGTFQDVARLGGRLANWAWLLAAFSITVLIMDTSGVWLSIRVGRDIAAAIDTLSTAARQIAAGNFAWRAPVRHEDQLGELVCNFNEMAIDLERLQKEEAANLRIESELQAARSVQEYLYPRVAPVLRGATVSGRTSAARTVAGDLYDFIDLGHERLGVLCADVSGKGISAALMMANLQAIARAQPAAPPAQFVEILNRQLAGRFGDNRYATLFWAVYDTNWASLTYVNAGHPAPILIHSDGGIERLDSDGFPAGMFANAQYTARELQMQPGSRLVIFTDGLTDAQKAGEEEFGEERLIECCRTIRGEIDATGVVEGLMQTVAEWSNSTEQFDDTTVVVIDVAP